MSTGVRTLIPLDGHDYRPNNFSTQDEQNAHDDRQRNMLNY